MEESWIKVEAALAPEVDRENLVMIYGRRNGKQFALTSSLPLDEGADAAIAAVARAMTQTIALEDGRLR
jgi:hypothetical protein